MPAARNLAVLVGNGLSIGFNPDLSLQAVTDEVKSRITKDSENGGQVVETMAELAKHALQQTERADSDFEALVGAFGVESRALEYLERLRLYSQPDSDALRQAILDVQEFAEEVRIKGISHVLEVIYDRSESNMADSESLRRLVSAVRSHFEGRITYSNLNYDTLLLASLMADSPGLIADMADGSQKQEFSVRGERSVPAVPLRRDMCNFPKDRRIRLLNLHGSVTFWWRANGGGCFKFTRDDLSRVGFWNAIRGGSGARPAAVLSSPREKVRHVQEYPFSVAYQGFEDSLLGADHWLIIGYSFRDEPVNARLREAFLSRSDTPKVLVVTLGDDLNSSMIVQAFGQYGREGEPDWLTIDRSGAVGLESHREWSGFVAR